MIFRSKTEKEIRTRTNNQERKKGDTEDVVSNSATYLGVATESRVYVIWAW